jgi:hypothetical protein
MKGSVSEDRSDRVEAERFKQPDGILCTLFKVVLKSVLPKDKSGMVSIVCHEVIWNHERKTIE